MPHYAGVNSFLLSKKPDNFTLPKPFTTYSGLSQAGGSEGHVPPQFLADQLTLSQPGGAHYPHPVLHAPPWIFRPCDGPEMYLHEIQNYSSYLARVK